MAGELFGPLQTPPSVGRVAPEQFRAGKDDQFSIRKNKAARQRAFEKLDAFHGLPHDLAETLDFAFGLEIENNAKSARAPIPQPRGKLRALRFNQHEIPDSEISDVAFFERAPKILGFLATEPALADQDFGFGVFLRLDLDPECVARDVVSNDRALIFRRAKEDFDAL